MGQKQYKTKRLEFYNILKEVLGSNNVYFQPPSTIKMNYPCIVYSLNRFNKKLANNGIYIYTPGYTVSLISSEPDSEVIDKLISLPHSTFDRHYVSNNLNHYVFTIYF